MDNFPLNLVKILFYPHLKKPSFYTQIKNRNTNEALKFPKS